MEFAIYAAYKRGYTRTGRYPFRRFEPKTVPTFASMEAAENKIAEMIAANPRVGTCYNFEIRDVTPKAENRDECQICVGAWIIKNGLTSLHGYTRPGCGWLVGECMGARELPYSKSCEVLHKYAAMIESYRADLVSTRDEWTSGQIAETLVEGTVRDENGFRIPVAGGYKKEMIRVTNKTTREEFRRLGFFDRDWNKTVAIAVAKLDGQIRQVEAEIERVAKRLADWKLVG